MDSHYHGYAPRRELRIYLASFAFGHLASGQGNVPRQDEVPLGGSAIATARNEMRSLPRKSWDLGSKAVGGRGLSTSLDRLQDDSRSCS
jgi:hypothetical protein